MDKSILKHTHVLLMTASVFLLSACGVNVEKTTADINSSIQADNIESATETYSTTIEKLKNNPSTLSEFEDVLVDSLTENMESKYKEVLKDYSKANEFNDYLDNIKKLNIKNSKFTDSWLSYDSKVEDILTYNQLQTTLKTIKVEENPEMVLEHISKISTNNEFYDAVAPTLKTLEETANATLEKEMLDDFYGIWLEKYTTTSLPNKLVIFRPGTNTSIPLTDISNINLNESININTYTFEIVGTYRSQNTIQALNNGMMENTFKFINSDRTKMELSYVTDVNYLFKNEPTKREIKKANLTYLGEEENLEQIFKGLQNQ